MNKETTIQKLYSALEKLEQARKCSNRISDISCECNKKIDNLAPFDKKQFKTRFIISIIIYFVLQYCFLPNVKSEHIISIINPIITLLSLFIIFITLVKPIARKCYMKTKSYRKKVEAYRQEEKEATKQYREQIWALRGEAKRILNISDEYIDYDILCNLLSYLESGRADTLKEAINALETDCFRGRMEAQQRDLSDEIDSLRKDVIAAYYR